MAKDYNELEQLVNDVTNIDTARMTLRWALERLNAVEKEKAELKKNLTVAEEAGKGLEIKVKSLQESFSSRAKTLDEKEDFYGKLEATMALLGEGKLDIQQLLKKEAKLDHLRREMENEYQEKFEDLDRSQASLIERWNQRLLGVEEQYAKRLAEAQKQYDDLRGKLESDHQSRLGALEKTYQLKEKELTDRIKLLEFSVKSGEGKLEGRKKELEAEFIAKKNEVEANYIKLKSMLEASLDDRVRSLDGEHAEQVKSLEKSWNQERSRLIEETRIRDAQFAKAQDEIAALEKELSAQQEKHHSDLMAVISEKEQAFKNRAAELEREKAAYEAAVKELAGKLAQKENEWVAEKEKLQAGYVQRAAELEAAVKERAGELEKEHAARGEELKSALAAAKAGFEKDADARVEAARGDMELEKARLAESLAQGSAALAGADAFIKDLQRALAATREEHHRELMEKIRSGEEAFRAQVEEFEAEKERFQGELARAAEAAGAKEAALATEYAAKEEAVRKEAVRRLEMERAAWQSQIRRLEDLLAAGADDFKKAQKEISELTSRNALAGEQLLDKEAAFNREMAEVKANYEKELNLRVKDMVEVQTSHLLESLEEAKSRNEEEAAFLRDKDAEIERLKNEMAEEARRFEERLMTAESLAVSGKIDELEAAYRAKKERLEAETAELKNALDLEYRTRHEELAKDFGIKSRQAALENDALRAQLEKMRKDVFEANVKAETFFNDMMERKRAHQDEIKKLNEDHMAELHVKTGEAAAKASEALSEKLYFAEEGMVKLQRDHMDEVRAMKDIFQKEKERLAEDIARRESCIEAGDIKIAELESEITRHKADAAIELRARLAGQEDKFNAVIAELAARRDKAEKEAEDRLGALKASYEAKLKEAEEKSAGTLANVTESLSEKLFAAEEGMVKLQRDHMDEVRVMQGAFQKEKERLAQDIAVLENSVEAGKMRASQLESELAHCRHDAAAETLRSLEQQEDKFNAVLADYRARQAKLEQEASARLEEAGKAHIARIHELEAALQSKDALMCEHEDQWRRKHQELDDRLAELNAARSRMNADRITLEQNFAAKERELSDRNLQLERKYSAERVEVEKLKIELTRVIMEYKNRK